MPSPAQPVGIRPGTTRRADPPDLVAIYAGRLRDAADAPPLFATQSLLKIGRGTPGFKRRRPAAMIARDVMTPRRLTRRVRLVLAAAATLVTTALTGTVLVG